MSDFSTCKENGASLESFLVLSTYIGTSGRVPMDELIDALVRILQANLSKRYSEHIDQFFVLLRFGSRFDLFTKGSVHSLRISSKKRFASFYVDFNLSDHISSDESTLASKIAFHLSDGSLKLAARNERRDPTFQSKIFEVDLCNALSEFTMQYGTRLN